MDWYSWLSKTNLELTLVSKYGQAFVRNELQEEDLTYFNHEFLQSIGISVAKHRLEILKLAKKDLNQGSVSRLSKLVSAVNKTRKLITRNISKLSSPILPFTTAPDRSPYRNHWGGALRRINTNGANQVQKSVMVPSRNMMWSGPLDKRGVPQHEYMLTNSLSGPLDGKVHQNWSPVAPMSTERSGFICRSPTRSGPLDRFGLSPHLSYYSSGKLVDRDEAQSLWSLMFQDMKPT